MAELYMKYPVLCTIWAFMEIVCFGGVIFGWGSLVYVLKEEGFYGDICLADDSLRTNLARYSTVIPPLNNGSTTNQITSNVTTDENSEKSLSPYIAADENTTLHYVGVTCPNQESRLNLWFSIAVSFMYLAFAGIGYLIRRVGTRITRVIFLIVYLIGTLCLAFATPEVPWLLLPGLCCVGTGGLTMLATNLQVANLHPHIRSTIVAIFTGLFDFSSVTKQLIKVAYEHGIARRSCYIFVSCIFTVIIFISTFFMLPYKSISDELVADLKRKRDPTKSDNIESDKDENLLEKIENHKEERTYELDNEKVPPRSLCATLLSFTVILHLYWLFVHALRFVTFIGLLNRWLEDVTNHNEEKVGQLLGVFAYTTMGAIGTALLCGFIYDWQRNKYTDSGPIRRIYCPVVLPMSLVIAYSITTTVLCYIKNFITPYFAFVVFTFFRSSLFTVAVAFIGEAYPIDYFGVLFGFIQFAAGLAGLIQYPIFEWYDAYEGSYEHVNILLLALQISTIIHPLMLFIRGRRDHNKRETNGMTLIINKE